MKNTELRAHLFVATYSNTLQKVQTLRQIQDLHRMPKRIPTFSEQHQLFHGTAHRAGALPKGRCECNQSIKTLSLTLARSSLPRKQSKTINILK